MARRIPCGPDSRGIVEGVREFAGVGFRWVALIQMGERQKELCSSYERELAGALKGL